MDKKFLDKVIKQLISETRWDKDAYYTISPVQIERRAFTSGLRFTIYHGFLWDLREHLTTVYGLSGEESDRVWYKYREWYTLWSSHDNGYSLNMDRIVREK